MHNFLKRVFLERWYHSENIFESVAPLSTSCYWVGLLPNRRLDREHSTVYEEIQNGNCVANATKIMGMLIFTVFAFTERPFKISSINDLIGSTQRLGNIGFIAVFICATWKNKPALNEVFRGLSRLDASLEHLGLPVDHSSDRRLLVKTIIIIYSVVIIGLIIDFWLIFRHIIESAGHLFLWQLIYATVLNINLNLLLLVVLHVLVNRCRMLIGKLQTGIPAEDLAGCRSAQREIWGARKGTSLVFQGQILLKSILNYLYITFLFFSVIVSVDEVDFKSLLATALWASFNVVDLIFCVCYFDRVAKECETCVNLYNGTLRNLKARSKLENKFELFQHQVQFERNGFSICSLFPFTLSFTLTVCGSIFTNVIVLYQFHAVQTIKSQLVN